MWISEEVSLDARAYFANACEAIRHARESVVLEMYIFRHDTLGNQLLELLRDAAHRGVGVRVLVDGVGSPAFNRDFVRSLQAQKIAARVFHPTPHALELLRLPSVQRLRGVLANINKRNHRKLIIVDNAVAFVGSCNVDILHSRWRETAVRVQGGCVSQLRQSFELIWSRASYSGVSASQRWRERLQSRRAMRVRRAGAELPSSVRTNITGGLRVRHNADLASRIECATKQVWITTAYFVPSPVIIAALIRATRNGCDVRLLLPGKSDVSVVSSVSRMFYLGLMRAGVKIYEYQPSVLHAKTLLIDNWACVGTTNLNHRSFYHDLEVDVVLYQKASLNTLAECYLRDLADSVRITPDNLHSRSWLEKVSGYLVYPFKSFI